MHVHLFKTDFGCVELLFIELGTLEIYLNAGRIILIQVVSDLFEQIEIESSFEKV